MEAALHGWHEFYLLLGTAAATLVALLFVAVSVGPVQGGPVRTYMSPVVVHFAAVLFMSALAIAPLHGTEIFVGGIGLASIAGLIVSAIISARVMRDPHPEVVAIDRLAYGLVPAFGYCLSFTSALMVARDLRFAPEVFAAALLVLLLVNIRNAWDLMLTRARHRPDA